MNEGEEKIIKDMPPIEYKELYAGKFYNHFVTSSSSSFDPLLLHTYTAIVFYSFF